VPHPTFEALEITPTPSRRVLGAPADVLDDDAAIALSELLRHAPALRSLTLDVTRMGDAGVEALLDAVAERPGGVRLGLTGLLTAEHRSRLRALQADAPAVVLDEDVRAVRSVYRTTKEIPSDDLVDAPPACSPPAYGGARGDAPQARALGALAPRWASAPGAALGAQRDRSVVCRHRGAGHGCDVPAAHAGGCPMGSLGAPVRVSFSEGGPGDALALVPEDHLEAAASAVFTTVK
jgi:hypothetical protein